MKSVFANEQSTENVDLKKFGKSEFIKYGKD